MTKTERDSIGERLASNPGTPIAVAAALVAGFSPFSPIRHAVDGVKRGISWIQDGVRRPAGGTVDAAPAAPTPSADAGTPPAPTATEAEPAAASTPTPSTGDTVWDAYLAGRPISYGQYIALQTRVAVSDIPREDPRRMAITNPSWAGQPLHGMVAELAAVQLDRGFIANGAKDVPADVGSLFVFSKDPGPGTPTISSMFSQPSSPESTSPGPSPSPQTGGNDGGWLDDGITKVPGLPIAVPSDTDVSFALGDNVTDAIGVVGRAAGKTLGTAATFPVALASGLVHDVADLFGFGSKAGREASREKSKADLRTTKQVLTGKKSLRELLGW